MDPAWQDVLVRAINIYLHGNLQAMLDDSVDLRTDYNRNDRGFRLV